ncbi:hypothetical protein EJB05_51507, partial [Eragrostis curvula]
MLIIQCHRTRNDVTKKVRRPRRRMQAETRTMPPDATGMGETMSPVRPASMARACFRGVKEIAKPLLSSGEIKQLVDPLLGSDYDCDEMERMTLAASLCTRTASHSRPEMSLILKLLQGDDETIGWARSQVTASFDGSDEEAATPDSNMQSHLSLALLGVEDDTLSHCSSTERTVDTSADGYWSRSSSFD